jgi:hypothetical protein
MVRPFPILQVGKLALIDAVFKSSICTERSNNSHKGHDVSLLFPAAVLPDEVARRGSISGAAECLNVSPSAPLHFMQRTARINALVRAADTVPSTGDAWIWGKWWTTLTNI